MTRGGAHGGLKVRAFPLTQTKTTLIRTGVQVAYGSGDEGKIEERSGGEAGMWHCCLFRMDGCGLKIVPESSQLSDGRYCRRTALYESGELMQSKRLDESGELTYDKAGLEAGFQHRYLLAWPPWQESSACGGYYDSNTWDCLALLAHINLVVPPAERS